MWGVVELQMTLSSARTEEITISIRDIAEDKERVRNSSIPPLFLTALKSALVNDETTVVEYGLLEARIDHLYAWGGFAAELRFIRSSPFQIGGGSSGLAHVLPPGMISELQQSLAAS